MDRGPPWGQELAWRSPADHRHPLEVVGEDSQPDPVLCAVEVAQVGAAQSESSLEVADAGFDSDPPVAYSPKRSGVFVFASGLAEGAAALQADMSDAEGGQGLVVGGGAEAAVADHGGGTMAGRVDDLLDGGEKLGSVAGVALVDLVEREEAGLVFGDQGGVAELGWVLGLALADRAGVRVGQ